MYREPPLQCSVCGRAIERHDADVLESGVRCRRCGDAAELAALAPTVAEVRSAQRQWQQYAATHPQPRHRGCSKHAEWDTHCFWCVLGSWLPDDDD
jgi:hypothetical protein